MIGTCPSCRNSGEIGAPCSERICQRRQFHFIPDEALDGIRTPDELVGLKLGKYLLVELLGAGGFGRVYRGLRLPLELQVAIKILHESATPADEKDRLRYFTQEAKAMAMLSHPNIVRLLDFGSHEGTPYLVTEFVAGKRTLKSEIRAHATSNQPYDAAEVRSILDQILNGLEAAHARGIVHRDIKPENIMLQPEPGHSHFVRIYDFGLAKFIDERTHTQSLLGTPMYMAPEQMEGRHIGPWTDLYAAAIIAYELMTGYRPFPNDTGSVLKAKRDPGYDVLGPLEGLSIPAAVKSFFKRGLALRPDDRIRSVDEFRVALANAFEATQAADDPALRSIDVRRLLAEQTPPRSPPSRQAPLPPPPLPPGVLAQQDERLPPTNVIRPTRESVQAVPGPSSKPGLPLPMRPATRPQVVAAAPARELEVSQRVAPTAAITPTEIHRARVPTRVRLQQEAGGQEPRAMGSEPMMRRQSRVDMPVQAGETGVPRPVRRRPTKLLLGGIAAVSVGVMLAIVLGGQSAEPAPGPRPPAVTQAPPPSVQPPVVATTPPEPAPALEPKAVPLPPPPPGFVRIEPGRFQMGSPLKDPDNGSDENPHEVVITRPFWIQATEVTQNEWRLQIENNPALYPGCGDSCPIENVTWFDAIAYANRLSFHEGLPACYLTAGCTGKSPGLQCREVTFRGLDCTGYRLPTEAEWEYAARAGTTTRTHAGDPVSKGAYSATALSLIAWYGGNSKVDYKGAFDCGSWRGKEIPATRCGTHKVRTKEPNPWGIHDMIGNVREWVHDGYAHYPDTSQGNTDPVGATNGSRRVIRGGGWSDEVPLLRSAARSNESPGVRAGTIGFRLARTAPR